MAETLPRPKRRKLELYRLTISGMVAGSDYQEFIESLWSNLGTRENRILNEGDKSHGLDSLRQSDETLWFQFFSYSAGERPEVIDTDDMTISANPLEPSEALLNWTHALGEQREDRYVLLVERVQTGIWPSKIEHYLDWLIGHPENEGIVADYIASSDEPISVALELEPDATFMKLVNSMDRIVSATVRINRPNPGWGDYEELLNEEARKSDAQSAEVTMKARRGASLAKRDGIVQAMKEAYRQNDLGRASVEGDIDGERKTISTTKHGKSQYKYLPVSSNGTVNHAAAFDTFFEVLGKMDDNVS